MLSIQVKISYILNYNDCAFILATSADVNTKSAKNLCIFSIVHYHKDGSKKLNAGSSLIFCMVYF